MFYLSAVVFGALTDPVALMVMALVGLLSRPWWGVLLGAVFLVAGGWFLRAQGGEGLTALVGLGSMIGYAIIGFAVWGAKTWALSRPKSRK